MEEYYCHVNEASKEIDYTLEVRIYSFLMNLKIAINTGREKIGAGREEELDKLIQDLRNKR